MVLALGRTNPLKNLPLTIEAWRALETVPRPAGARSCACSGSSPSSPPMQGMRYVESPSDERGRRAVQPGDRVRPDIHARGLLPAGPRVDGDRRRGRLHRRARQPRLLRGRVNCLMPEADTRRGQRRAWRACWPIRELRERLGRAGIETAAGLRVGAADRRAGGVLREVAAPRRVKLDGDVVPGVSAGRSG